MKVVIIEDEPFAQNELKRLLSNTSFNIEVLAVLESVEDAVLWFKQDNSAEVAFFDIQLSDGTSFEIFSQINIKTPIIFTTAYDQYAIEAFKVNSIDYLLKPIEQVALENALTKLQNWQKPSGNSDSFLSGNQLENLLSLVNNQSSHKSRFMAKVGDQIRFIKTEDIAYFYAEDNEVFLQTNENKHYIVDFSLDQLNNLVDPRLFHRINRKYTVNKNSISKVHKYFNSRLKIELKPNRDEEILISRVKVQEFLNWMEA